MKVDYLESILDSSWKYNTKTIYWGICISWRLFFAIRRLDNVLSIGNDWVLLRLQRQVGLPERSDAAAGSRGGICSSQMRDSEWVYLYIYKIKCHRHLWCCFDWFECQFVLDRDFFTASAFARIGNLFHLSLTQCSARCSQQRRPAARRAPKMALGLTCCAPRRPQKIISRE